VPHAPREIRRKTFSLVRRGFDPDEVARYLGELADQIDAITAAARQNRYRKLGQEVEAVLRTAHEQAARMRIEAKRAAKAIKDDAALYALEQKREADQDRDEAKRMLVRSQERASSLVREAEEQAAGVVRTAEALARTRTTQVLAQAQRRLDRVTRDEHQAQHRLRTAQVDLQAVIERVGDATPGVIDLTSDETTTDRPAAADQADRTTEPEGGDDRTSSANGQPLDASFALGRDGDPVAEMVREAVSTAVEHSGREQPAANAND
jgi:DivIVA domain-containing protein